MPNNNEAHFTKIWANKTFFTIYSEPSFCSLVYEGLQMEVSSLQNVTFLLNKILTGMVMQSQALKVSFLFLSR